MSLDLDQSFSLLGVVVPVLIAGWDYLIARRKRLGYRIQMSSVVKEPAQHPEPSVGQDWSTGQVNQDDLSFMLLRIENVGWRPISQADYAAPEGDPGVTMEFPGRLVEAARITEPSDDGSMFQHFTPEHGFKIGRLQGAAETVGTLTLPKVPLSSQDHYKVLVRLKRAGDHQRQAPYGRTTVRGTIKGGLGTGTIRRTSSVSRERWLIGLVIALVLCNLVQLLLGLNKRTEPLDCASGTLRLVGSTAIGPYVKEAADAYGDACRGAGFKSNFTNSADGLHDLDEAGRKSHGAPSMIAFSDGQTTQDLPQLLPRPMAFELFTVVVSKSAGVSNLSVQQVQDIYNGKITNWSQVNGNNLPIAVASRQPGSGTRTTFEQKVLQKTETGIVNSLDCKKRLPKAPGGILRCQKSSTDQMLALVAETPGAIGYSGVKEASSAKKLQIVSLGGYAPTLKNATYHTYPLWQVEYAYTYTEPRADSLADGFLRYLTDQAGRDVLRENGLTPCSELSNPATCTP